MKQSKMTVAEFLTKSMDLSGKTQREIAQAVGWPKPNVLSMMKQGQTKVPIDKAPALARACNVDPAAFMRLVLQEYWPDAWAALADTFGESLSTNEKRMVEIYRAAAPEGDLEVDEIVSFRVREALRPTN